MKANVVQLQIAYCAWVILAPASVSRFMAPGLPAWFACFLDVVRSGVEARPDDSPGQQYRRAIIHGASAEQPFPGEIRGRAILVESAVRRMTIEQLAAIGSVTAVCRALGCEPIARRPAAWRRELELATSPSEEAAA